MRTDTDINTAMDRITATRAARKNLWSAFWTFAFVVGLAALFWPEYSDVERLATSGRDAVPTAVSSSDTISGPKGRVSYRTEIDLDGTTTMVGLPFAVQAGQRFPIVYSPDSLANWNSQRKGWFYDYVIGSRADGTWHLYNRTHPTALAYGKLVFGGAVLAIFFFIWCYFSERPKPIDRNV